MLKMQNQSEWQCQNEESVMCMQLICYKQLNTTHKKVHHAFYNANFKQKGGAFFSLYWNSSYGNNFQSFWDLHILSTSDISISCFLSEMSVGLLFRISSCHPSISSCEHLISTKKLIHLCSTQVWLMTHWLGFTKGKSCLTNLISFYHKVTHLERRKRRHWKYFFWVMLLIVLLTASFWTNCWTVG